MMQQLCMMNAEFKDTSSPNVDVCSYDPSLSVSTESYELTKHDHLMQTRYAAAHGFNH